jgi:hypothetical protein
LINHKNDFGITAEWHFFATSHGESSCDAVGGTIKQPAARASLQHPYDKQIFPNYPKISMNLHKKTLMDQIFLCESGTHHKN